MFRRVMPFALVLSVAGSVGASAQSAAPSTGAATPSAVAADSATALALGQRLTAWLWAAEVDSLWAHANDQSRTTLGTPDNLANQILEFVGRFGAETTVVRESLARQGENYRYTRVVHLEAAEEPWTLAWTLSPDLKVMDLDLQPGS